MHSTKMFRRWLFILAPLVFIAAGCGDDDSPGTSSFNDIDSCSTDSDCGEPQEGPWGSCEAPDNICSLEGERSRDVTVYSCDDGQCTSETQEETETCPRDTDDTGCEDGLECTAGSSCDDGECTPGTIRNDWCLIESSNCIADGDHHADDSCLHCDTDQTQQRWLSDCFSEVSSDGWHACALDTAGDINCWGLDIGQNNFGQVTEMASELADADDTLVEVTTGTRHSCAIDEPGDIYCWGDPRANQLDVPADGAPFRQIKAGEEHTCAIDSSDEVRCWGSQSDGQVTVPDTDGVVEQLSVGSLHTCGLDESGEVYCWGDDRDGQASPDLPADTEAVELSVGRAHSCANDSNGQVHCWGADQYNQTSDIPTDISFEQIDSGGWHTCGADESGQLHCWGRTDYDQADIPDELADAIVTDIGAGDYHTCIVDDGGDLHCWGVAEDDDEHFYGQTDPPS